ncbi:hypothetical protein [Brenneria rubrifaciens]|uniref:hypothetical protein n=1 Tax=Brenneria rubrifaciens TaxID=55213 RepID=UPI001585E4E1|nr:hypothetical protein [Brenneria rubrifaciens]
MNNAMASVVVMLVMGIVGYLLQKHHYPIAPVILCMLLGPMFEKSLLSSLLKSDGNLLAFVERPISALLAVLFLIVVIMQAKSIIQMFKTAGDEPGNE